MPLRHKFWEVSMINLEQVKLLESKVAKAIGYIEEFAKENAGLHKKEAELQARLENYQKRIDELEVLVMRFKEDQGRIEDAILSALNKLNQFEEALEKSLWDKPADQKPAAKEQPSPSVQPGDAALILEEIDSGDGKTCFEIPSAGTWAESVLPEDGDDIADPMDDMLDEVSLADDGLQQKDGELDIF